MQRPPGGSSTAVLARRIEPFDQDCGQGAHVEEFEDSFLVIGGASQQELDLGIPLLDVRGTDDCVKVVGGGSPSTRQSRCRRRLRFSGGTSWRSFQDESGKDLGVRK